MYTRSEARIPKIRALIEATCEVETILRKHGVNRLIIDHSAAWYYVRFGVLSKPTKFYNLVNAITPKLQRQLIEELRQNHTQALLKVQGFKALGDIDGVPNGIMIPIVEAYLKERRKGIKPIRTGIGDLYIFDNPHYRLKPPPAMPFSPLILDQARKKIRFVVDSLVSAPSGFLIARGWAFEWRGKRANSRPLKRLFLYSDDALVGELSYRSARPDVAQAFQNESLNQVGWGLDLVVPSSDIDSRALGIRALLSDGGFVDFKLDTSKLRKLPRLHGQEWSSLPREVLEAKRMAQAF
jgi:hypothetical protein